MDQFIRDQINGMIYAQKEYGIGWKTANEWAKAIGMSPNQIGKKLRTLEQLKLAKRIKLRQLHGFKTLFWINNISEKLAHESDTGIHTTGRKPRVRDSLQRSEVSNNRKRNKGESKDVEKARPRLQGRRPRS